MSLATEARRVLETLPPGVRETLESAVAFVPRPLLYGARFRAVRAEIAREDLLPAEQLRAAQDARVRDLVAWCYERVPYYRRVMDERGVKPEHVRGARDLPLLPLLDRATALAHIDELLARGVPAREREIVSTSGTSGAPMRLWIERARSSTEWAYMTAQWGRVGYRPGDRRVVLRATEVKGAAQGRLHEFHPLLDELILSTFHLTAETLPRFLARIEAFGPAFFHAYPSSAEALAALVMELPAERRPRFRALLVGSENLYPAQRARLEAAFGCPVFAWYGHSEKCLLGGGCERSRDYHMFPGYGVVELVEENGEPVGPGGEGTIVGTGFMNRVMPFLRYATDDRGTWAADSGPLGVGAACACGRAHPRLAMIEGHRTGERLFGAGGETVTMTALTTHADLFEHVRRYRFRQDTPGAATILVVPGPGFHSEEGASVAREFGRHTGDVIRFTIELVDDLPLTTRGKFKFVEQLIPEDVLRSLAERRHEVA